MFRGVVLLAWGTFLFLMIEMVSSKYRVSLFLTLQNLLYLAR